MKVSACLYCGNNPVPHRIYWYNESLNILMTPLRQKLLYNGLTRFAKKQQWGEKLAPKLLALGEAVKIISRQNDISKSKVRRAQVVWEEAERRGIVMSELLLFGKPIDSYIAEKNPLSLIPNPSQLKIKDKRLRIIFSGLPRPDGYTNNWLDLMDDKWLLKDLFIKNNLPVAHGASCRTFEQAKKIFLEIQKGSNSISNISYPISVIIKPRAGSRGRHTTTFVQNEADLKKAFKIAKQLCAWVIVEEQLFGPVYRATIINGHLAGVLRGDAPQVVGDGKSTIEELVKAKNAVPKERVKDIKLDNETAIFLARQNLKITSVPEVGQVISLSEKVGLSYGGSSSEDYDICHSDNKELFLRAAKVLGDPIIGFDFIIPDITVSYKHQKCGFIEANSLPFINLHHDPLLGTPRNAAALIWDMVGW